MLVGIDIGSHKVCTLVGEALPGGGVRVHGMGHAPSDGIRHGEVVHIEDAAGAIAASVERAERVAGQSITRARIGVSGLHLAGANNNGFVPCGRRPRTIEQADVERALEVAGSVLLRDDRSVLHVLARHYTVDDGGPVDSPVDMEGHRLEAAVHIVTAAHSALANLLRCLELAEVRPVGLTMSTLAAAEATLSEDERELGVVVIDLGAAVTGIACYVDGALCHTAVLPVGGRHMTNDLGVVLQTPLAEAERIKLSHGHVLPELDDDEATIEIVPFGDDKRRATTRLHVAEVLAARADEIASLVAIELGQAGLATRLAAGAVLVGGGTELTGMPKRLGARLGLPARVGTPGDVLGLADAARGPGHAAPIGLLRWEATSTSDAASVFTTEPEPTDGLGRIVSWARHAFLPNGNGHHR
ncbi:MAG: cell division protein FtsA [Anaerolineae bacterium]|jgi:cell division protein FtsA